MYAFDNVSNWVFVLLQGRVRKFVTEILSLKDTEKLAATGDPLALVPPQRLYVRIVHDHVTVRHHSSSHRVFVFVSENYFPQMSTRVPFSSLVIFTFVCYKMNISAYLHAHARSYTPF